MKTRITPTISHCDSLSRVFFENDQVGLLLVAWIIRAEEAFWAGWEYLLWRTAIKLSFRGIRVRFLPLVMGN